MKRQVTASLLVAFAMYSTSRAHDYWLQPKSFRLSPGQATAVHLFVGDHLARQAERPYQAKKTVAFQLVSKRKIVDLKPHGEDGKKPVARISPQQRGGYLVVMERDWAHIEIKASKFNDYLEHEGLSQILKLRRQTGEDKSVGRERYCRYLKSLVQVGDTKDDTFARKLGHRLEIIPTSNPAAAAVGSRLGVIVLFDGKPLPGAQIEAYHRSGERTAELKARTDNDGKAQFKIDRPGMWLIRLVHMQRCRNVPGYDWESFWAAYSFHLQKPAS